MESIRKTRRPRVGDAIDQRINAALQSKGVAGTASQLATAGTGSTGTAENEPTAGPEWLTYNLLATDGNGTDSFDIGLLADTGLVKLLVQIVRGANKEVGEMICGNDGTNADTAGFGSLAQFGGFTDVSFACSVVSGRLRLTATANGTWGGGPPTPNAAIRLVYLTVPRN